jgi:hypothetical protein
MKATEKHLEDLREHFKTVLNKALAVDNRKKG